MQLEAPEFGISSMGVHPENRVEEESQETPSQEEAFIERPSLCKVLLFAFLAGTVGSVLTMLSLGSFVAGADSGASLYLVPLVLMLVAVINGWIAVNVFVGSGIRK